MRDDLDISNIKKLFVFFDAVFLVEFFNSACCIEQLLFARKERVAGRANFDFQITGGAACFKSIAAGTGDCHFVIFGMDSTFHFFDS